MASTSNGLGLGTSWIPHGCLEQLLVMVTHSRVIASVPIVLSINVLKNLDLPCVLSWVEQLDRPERGCGLRAAWLNVIQAFEAYWRANKQQTERVGMVHTSLKQKLLLARRQEVV